MEILFLPQPDHNTNILRIKHNSVYIKWIKERKTIVFVNLFQERGGW